MTSSADVIVLSSSPDPPLRTPTRITVDPERQLDISPQDETPPSLPSRSRYFPPSKATDDAPKPKRRTTKETTTSDPNAKDASTKPPQTAKRAAKGPKSKVLGNVETGFLDSRDNVAKKAMAPAKGRPRKNTKSKESVNMTLAGKVTKSSNEPQVKKTSKAGKKASEMRLSPGDSSENPGFKESNALAKDEQLFLDKALRRRVDWTPPKEDVSGRVLVVVDDNDDKVDDDTPDSTMTGLGGLLSNYNYSGSGPVARELPANTIGGGLTKRRRIELVDPQVYNQTSKVASNDDSSVQEGDSSSSNTKTKKKPKTQKRFTTLTARMTAQYATNDTEDDLMDDIIPDIGKAKSRRGKAKSTDKGPGFTVLSPEAATRSLETQDLMFGTCSQLEREDSPQRLREMQQAIRESERLVPVEREASAGSGVVSRRAGERKLWSVGARDAEGSLIQAEFLDVMDLTDPTDPFDTPKKKETAPVVAKAHALTARDDDWLDLDIEKLDSSPKKTAPALQPRKCSKPMAKPKSAACAELVAPARGVSAEEASSQRADSQRPSMPHYSGFTDAELSIQVASFGFKSVRSRKKMIDLLQKCWESGHGGLVPVTVNETPQVADPTQTATQTTAKPKEKAKSKRSTSTTSKAMTKKASDSGQAAQPSFIDVEEIQDSEEDIFLSPSQVQKRYTEIFSRTTSSTCEPSLDIMTKAPQTPSPKKRKTTTTKSSRTAKQVTTSISEADKADSSKRSSLPNISMQITKAVRLQSHSSHPSTHASRIRPTWQEKIVMYDPIILEDLTTWLNVEGLGLVGEDREVDTGIVREWCESKGICCCWKKNASY